MIDTLINIVHVYTSRFMSKRARWRRSTKIFRQRTFKEVSDNETFFGEYELYIIQFSKRWTISIEYISLSLWWR